MSKPLSWQLNVFKEYGVTPDEARKRAVEIMRKYNYAYMHHIDCPVDEVTDWELITDLLYRKDVDEYAKKFDLSTPSGCMDFDWAFCG